MNDIVSPAGEDTARTRWLARFRRLLPFVSLATATTSAILMDRTPSRATLIGACALLGWLVVVVAAVIVRRADARGDDRADRRSHLARFLALFLSQLVLQQALAFPLPFFARAAWPLVPAHAPFLAAYAIVVAVVWWDPAFAAVVRRPLALVVVQAFAAFAALLVSLPILGFDNTTTTAVAGVVTGIGVPLWAALANVRDRRRGGVVGALALAVGIGVTLGVRFVPPAPLSLGAATFAKAVVDRAPVEPATRFVLPESLVCHTAIQAPLGLRDALFHVWRHDGVVVQRVPLTITGGARSGGFRTWSRRSFPGPGAWECRVETALGQVVGVTHAVVAAR